MIKHFVNLTNGIEAIPEIRGDFSFIRIQSTTIEQRNYYKLFADLDHNLLMWLVLGAECRIYDFGTNRPLSKTIYIGLPIIEYCLNKYWLGHEMENVWVGRKFNHNSKGYIEEKIYSRLFAFHDEKLLPAKISMNTRFKYYRKFIPDNLERISLIGCSTSTKWDSNTCFYKQILKENLQVNFQ